MPSRTRPEHRTAARGEKREQAEELAIAAFGFLAADSDRLSRFLTIVGIDISTLREATRDPDFLAGVLDHICGEETLLLAFATERGVERNAIMRGRNALGGGAWERDTP
jgi:hypothetical protein